MNEPIINLQELCTNVATNLTEDAIKASWSTIKKYFSDKNAHTSIDLGYAYIQYLNNASLKYGQIKNLIYRRIPKYIYSFYESIGIKYNDTVIDTSLVTNITHISKRVIITGTGGIGKTTLLKHLFLNTISQTDRIPVIVELRAFNSLPDNISLYDFIYDSLSNNGFGLNKEYFEYSMKEGAYNILLDGYDELNRNKAKLISKQIQDISDKFLDNNYILTSRPLQEFIGWNTFCEMESMPLTKEQAINLINKLEFNEHIKAKFITELSNGLFEKYESFASNPLLLTIMLLTYEANALLPEKINDFYEQAFITLFNTHDATKDSYSREISSGLCLSDFKLIFSHICFKSYFSGIYEFTDSSLMESIDNARKKYDNIKFKSEDFQADLTQSVCMMVKDGLTYHFSHRSFQEYFAAWYICKLEDTDQKKVLKAWLEQSPSIISDSFFTMLFNMQSEKTNSLILSPVITNIQRKYEADGFNVNFIKSLIRGIHIRNDINEISHDTFAFLFTVKDRYLWNSFSIFSKLNNCFAPRNTSDFDFEIAKKIINNTTPESGDFLRSFSLDEVLKYISEEELIQLFQWLQENLLLCFKVNQKYTQPRKKYKKLSKILDNL